MDFSVGQSTNMPLISTRDNFDLATTFLKMGQTPTGYSTTNNILNMQSGTECPKESVIYVHGVWTARDRVSEVSQRMFENAIEIVDMASLSLGYSGYEFPVIGFSWDSDTKISETGWSNAKKIANENGPKLAQFIVDFKEKCPQTKIQITAHSLGARVVLSSLDSLNNNQNWNENNFNISTVFLMGAAVDSSEVSKNPDDIFQTDPDSIKQVYGHAIEKTVSKFYNLVNSEDDTLEPGDFVYNWFVWPPYKQYLQSNTPEFQPTYYPYFEQHLALGQEGMDSDISSTEKPLNYVDIYMDESEILNYPDADADRECDLVYLVPFSSNFRCTITQLGDNHLGYAGFRGNAANSLTNEGAMDIALRTFQVP